MKIKKVYASDVAALDSDVLNGGGTDDTAALQAVLDLALTEGGVWLVMDGAALVSGLKLHSNTTIECLGHGCGFYQKPHSGCCILTNAEWDHYELKTRNIHLFGGTYNQDADHQPHDVPSTEAYPNAYRMEEKLEYHPAEDKGTGFSDECRLVYAMEFYGVEHLTVRDVTIRNPSSWSFVVGGFHDVTIENISIELPEVTHRRNQDGLHFWGPGSQLVIRNLHGRTGDDIINLAPDEMDGHSDITDVLVDGVFMDECDYGIHMLTRGTGRLDQVTVRNVSGSVRSFACRVNCFFPDVTYGNFGRITLENFDVRLLPCIGGIYEPASVIRVGGNIECLILKDLYLHNPNDSRALIELGRPFFETEFGIEGGYVHPAGIQQKLQCVIVDGLTVCGDKADRSRDFIQVFTTVDNLILRNILVLREPSENTSGRFLAFYQEGDKVPYIRRLITDSVTIDGVADFGDASKIGRHIAD